MHVDFEDTVVRGLRRYVRSVGIAVGLDGECSYIHTAEPTTAYIPMEGRLLGFPERDVALLWDERHGWSAAVETHSGEDLMVVAYLGRDLLAPPRAVARWVKQIFLTHHTANPVGEPPVLANDDVRHRLATYTDPSYASASD